MMDKKLIDFLKNYADKYDVLVVEDDETALNYISQTVNKFFNRVYKASNGEEALEIFKNKNVDIIITDINMPKKNGLELIEDVRAIYEDIKIIIISAYSDSEFFQKAIELNVDGYIIKPIKIVQFLITLAKTVKNLKLKEEKNRYLNLLQQYEKIVNESAIFAKIDKNRDVIYVNDELITLTGFNKEDFIGKNYRKFIELDEEKFQELHEIVVEKKTIYKGILKLKTKNNNNKYIKFIIKPILNDDEIEEFILVGYDVSAIMNPKKLLLDKIENSNNPMLAIFNIENYYDLLRLFGEKISEEFEKEVFNHIKELCHSKDIYLLENGEIAVFSNEEDDYNKFFRFIRDILMELNNKKVILNGIIYDLFLVVSVSKGKNCFDDCRIGINVLKSKNINIINADNYLIKEKNKAIENLNKLTIIKNAINENNVFCMYQPIVNNSTFKIMKYEALLRIKNKDKVLVPGEFLNIAKKSNFYIQMTRIVLEQSIEFIKKFNENNISVNVSSIDLDKITIRNEIYNVLKKNSDIISRLTFELLESEEIEKNEEMKKFIKKIKDLGVKIAIDDFGSGYSNFIRLLYYQPDYIKIDGSIIKEIDKNIYAYNVAKTIVKFAKENNITTIAEYVENEQIFEKVKELGIDCSQGYFFSKPKMLEHL